MRGRVDITRVGPDTREDIEKREALRKGKLHYIVSVLFVIVLILIIVLTVTLTRDSDDDKIEVKKDVTTSGVTEEKPATTIATTRTTTTMTTTPTTTQARTLLEQLQDGVGPNLEIIMSDFSNWDGTATRSSIYVTSPKSLDELQSLIRVVSYVGLKARAMGSALSYSDLLPDSGQVLIQTNKLTTSHDNEPMWFNEDLMTVTAMAGISVHELLQFAVTKRVQLATTGSAKDMLIGGAIGTGVIGEDTRSSSISNLVVALRLVDSTGELRSYNEIQHPELLAALRCCVGLCGVYYDVTFKVVPLERVQVANEFIPSKQVLFNAKSILPFLQKEGVEFHFAPLTSLTESDWIRYNETGEMPQTYDPWDDILWIRGYTNASFVTGPVKHSRKRRSLPSFRLGFRRVARSVPDIEMSNMSTTTSQPKTHHSLWLHKVAYDIIVKFMSYDPEYQLAPLAGNNLDSKTVDPHSSVGFIFPDDSSLNATMDVTKILYDMLRTLVRGGDVPILTVMWRFKLISKLCYLCADNYNITSARYSIRLELVGADYKLTFPGFVNKLFVELKQRFGNELRVHWAKYHSYMHEIGTQMRASYADKMEKFNSLRKEYLDPNDFFITKSLQEILQ